MYLSYYKSLYRRVARLPLDHRSLEIARQKIRSHFKLAKNVPTYSVVDRKLYDRAVSVLDSILVDEKYKDFYKLLDLVYKDFQPRESWIDHFHNVRYGAFKNTWPQVHLIDEFGDEKSKNAYHKVLAELQPESNFLFVKAMSIPKSADLGSLTPLKKTATVDIQNEKNSFLLEKMSQFHKFLKSNAKLLLDTQIHMLEVCYKPNRYGLPPSIPTMESELKKKVNYAKSLLDVFKPISQKKLFYLIDFTTSKDDSVSKINPAFFRFMLRKRQKEEKSVLPGVRKYVRHKLLVSNERNILYCYRQYVVRQFYINEEGEYTMSPMRNIYD